MLFRCFELVLQSNALGAQAMRVGLAHLCLRVRKGVIGRTRRRIKPAQALAETGSYVIENFLSDSALAEILAKTNATHSNQSLIILILQTCGQQLGVLPISPRTVRGYPVRLEPPSLLRYRLSASLHLLRASL